MAKSNKFGTFGGVFTPSILTILGVIMYLRLPMIIGEAGLWATIGIIFIAHIISVTTGLSVSSIATDKKIKAGGTYYMVSRSMGLPIGGTLGLALFVGLSFSVSLYLIGFSESFLSYWGFDSDKNMIRITGSLILLAVTTITFISTSLAIKTQYFIMAAIVLSLISILFGNHEFKPTETLISDAAPAIPLMVLFGIFFPAVTGFEAGVSMSGDLKDPKRSIPSGSILAIVVGFVVYIGLTFFLYYSVDNQILAKDSQVLLKISLIPGLVVAGIWGATLSSALGSILGAPRILQATAVDKITPKFFAKGFGASNEPRNALLLTFIIAEAGILIGELDVIARIVSIFFITTYGFLNLSCAFETWTSADFRPSFKVSGWVCLIGSLACFIVMIQLDFLAMIGATIILSFVFVYLKRKELTLDTGDAWSSVWASLVKVGLQRLTKDQLHARNWRPNIIMFSKEGKPSGKMNHLGKAIIGKLGMMSAFELIESDHAILNRNQLISQGEEESTGYFKYKHFCKDVYAGMDEVSRTYGFSGIEPNTIMLEWDKNENNKKALIQLNNSFNKNEFNTIFFNSIDKTLSEKNRSIDIWWKRSGKNLTFAVNLIRYLTSSDEWKQAKVRLLVINDNRNQFDKLYKSISKLLESYRADIELRIINNELEKIAEEEIILSESETKDLVIIGIPDNYLSKKYAHLNDLVKKLNTTLLIEASNNFENPIDTITTSAFTTQKTEIEPEEELLLPELVVSKYWAIANDISKIDRHGNKLIEAFFNKGFLPFFLANIEVTQKLINIIDQLLSGLNAISEISESYLKQKQLTRLKNDFYFKIKSLLLLLKDESMVQQSESFQQALEWYSKKLYDENAKFPKYLIVDYELEDFAIRKSEKLSVKYFKILKKIKHFIVGYPITGKLRYREGAEFYLINKRHAFLSGILDEHKKEGNTFVAGFKKQISDINNLFENNNDLEVISKDLIENWQSLLIDIRKETNNLLENQNTIKKLFLNRFKLEFRKNLQLFNNELEKLNSNELIKKNSKIKKNFKKFEESNLKFTDSMFLHISGQLNKAYVDVLVMAIHHRIRQELAAFNYQLEIDIKKSLLQYLDKLKSGLDATNGIGHNKSHKTGLQNQEIDELINLTEKFKNNRDEILNFVDKLPETISINFDQEETDQLDDESIDIALSRVVGHFIDADLLGPLDSYLEEAGMYIRKSLISSREQVKLTRFNLENISTIEGQAFDSGNSNLIDDCILKVEEEKNNIVGIIDGFWTKGVDCVKGAFLPLSSYNIVESSNSLSRYMRDYKGQQVVNVFGAFSKKVKSLYTSQLSKLLYSRSEGILLAKKLSEIQIDSVQSKILDLKEKVSPSEDILKSLPKFYVNLFNGRSSIGSDFWISRSFEEEQFKKAIKRYKSGFFGGIMILGDRHCGKTSFSKYMADRHLQNRNLVNVFPYQEGGSIDEKDLVLAFQKASGIKGNLSEIMDTLQRESVIIINDMEMWWQRTTDGYNIIETLKNLIDTYGDKHLFIVNINPYAYKLINLCCKFEEHFIEVINCRPFDAEDLKELIIGRHQSSGLNFTLGNKEESTLSEVRLAQLFNAYFNFSKGNPGVALNAWLSNIQKVNQKEILISAPIVPSFEVLKELKKEWLIVITQLVLHKRLSFNRMLKITLIDEDILRKLLKAMTRTGLVIEKSLNIYALDPYLESHLLSILMDKDLI